MQLYPDVKCKVLYQRDYLNLLVKYGLEEPSQGSLTEAGRTGGAEVHEVLLGPRLAG